MPLVDACMGAWYLVVSTVVIIILFTVISLVDWLTTVRFIICWTCIIENELVHLIVNVVGLIDVIIPISPFIPIWPFPHDINFVRIILRKMNINNERKIQIVNTNGVEIPQKIHTFASKARYSLIWIYARFDNFPYIHFFFVAHVHLYHIGGALC